jgi:hypothetical protein
VTSPIDLCTGPGRGERPHAYSGPNGRLRMVYVTPPGSGTPQINFLYQAP